MSICVYLDKAAVEREVVTYGVLPCSLVGSVVREPLHDKLIYTRQSDPLVWTLLDGHGNQSNVADRKKHSLIRYYRPTDDLYRI